MKTTAKKFTAAVLVIVLVVSLYVPALAAETSALGEGTIEQRVAFIKENYDINIIYDYGYGSIASLPSDALAIVESALPYIGSVYTKKVASLSRSATGLDLTIDFRSEGIAGTRGAYSTVDNSIELFIPNSPGVDTVIHEFGHALDFANLGGSSTLWNTFTGMHSYPIDSSLSVSYYGSTNVSEDIAETFAHMVYYGGNTPNSSNATITAKKMIILDWLISEVGTGSNATKRAAAHMGIDLDTYNK